MLTAADLTKMRDTASEALPGTAVIYGGTFVSDGGGGGSFTYSARGTADCRIAPIVRLGEGEGQDGGRISSDAEYVVTLPYGQPITTDSQLRINGGTFNVEGIRDRSYQVSTRVEVKKVI